MSAAVATGPIARGFVHWTEVAPGRWHGRIPGRHCHAMVINHGYITEARIEFPLGRLHGQEFPIVADAQAAAEQWLTLTT